MENYKLIHTIIKSAVENGIRYIKDNPKRGLRNLLDLGEYFASGRFQKYFFELAHEILENEDSLYYDIIENLVKNTNQKNLTCYGINIGYNSFTYGAAIIRKHEKKLGCNIPWAVVFNFEEKSKNDLTCSEILNIVNSGKNMGIYSYMFFLDKNNISDELYYIFENNSDCAFTLLIDSGIINEKTAEKMGSFPNICIFISVDDYNSLNRIIVQKFNLMKKYKCLYGGYYRYDETNAKNITDGTVANKLLSLNSNFVICIKKHGCNYELGKNIYEYIYNTRIKINSPVFFIDFYGDYECIDKIISVESCFLSIKNQGQICVSSICDETGHNIRKASLESILADTMPKVKYI